MYPEKENEEEELAIENEQNQEYRNLSTDVRKRKLIGLINFWSY